MLSLNHERVQDKEKLSNLVNDLRSNLDIISEKVKEHDSLGTSIDNLDKEILSLNHERVQDKEKLTNLVNDIRSNLEIISAKVKEHDSLGTSIDNLHKEMLSLNHERVQDKEKLSNLVNDFRSNLEIISAKVKEHDSLGTSIDNLDKEILSLNHERVQDKEKLTNLANDLRSNLEIISAKVKEHDSLGTSIDDLHKEMLSLNHKRVQEQKEILSSLHTFREIIDINIDHKIAKQISCFLSDIGRDIENKAWLAKLLDARIDTGLSLLSENTIELPTSTMNYFVFEDKFRGSRVNIKERQSVFLPYFSGCKKVLDIGCGRGEFLELLKENGIKGVGIDIDPTMVDYCKTRGFDVKHVDALSHLSKIPDESLDGIYISQLMEHLDHNYLIQMLFLCAKKLKYGFYIIAETVNPLSFFSFVNFYIDLSHIKPLHPETLRYIFSEVGFREIEVQFSSPVPEQSSLQLLPISSSISDSERETIEIYNNNIRLLNNRLFGPQDYSMIGKK